MSVKCLKQKKAWGHESHSHPHPQVYIKCIQEVLSQTHLTSGLLSDKDVKNHAVRHKVQAQRKLPHKQLKVRVVGEQMTDKWLLLVIGVG